MNIKNYNVTINYIQKAIQTLSDELDQDEVKSLLNRALSKLSDGKIKKKKQLSASEKYIEEAKLKSKVWWDKIKENIAKSKESAKLEEDVNRTLNNDS